MSTTKYYLFIIFLSVSNVSFSQSIKLGMQSGIGNYKMEDLKETNLTVLHSLPFEAKVISNFPSYLYYKPSFLISFDKLSFGIQISFNSSGSRISSKDYSGEYKYDTMIKCVAPNLIFDVIIFSFSEKFHIGILSELGLVYTYLNISENLNVNDEVIANDSFFMKAKNYNVCPGLKLSYNLYEFLDLELNTYYVSQFGKEVLKTSDDEMIIRNNDPIKQNWSGLRIGVSFLFKIPMQN